MKSISIHPIRIAALGGLIGAAFAASDQLDELILDAVESPSITTPSAAASREALAKTPGGTEVIDAEQILQGRASTLADTFALSPGVFAQSRFGADEARLSIRGSGLQRTFHGRGIRVLQDGIPINLADGGFDMQSLEPTATSHIRVWRGANALAYGSSTLGGAIEYVSRDGRNHPGGFFRVETGSWDYLRATIAGGIAGRDHDGYFSLTQHMQSGFRRHADQNNQRLFTNIGWRPAGHIENRTYLSAVVADSELPGNLTKAEMIADPRQADGSPFGALRYANKRDYELFRIANKTTVLVDAHRWDLILGHTYTDLDHPISPFVGVIDQLSRDTLVGLAYSHEGEWRGRNHSFRAGLMVHRGTIDNATFQNLPGGRRGALRGFAKQTAENLEFFAEEQLEIGGGVSGIVGLTAARTTRKSEVRFGPAVGYDRDYHNISPKIGARYDGAGFQIYANASGSYEPPSFSEAVTTAAANNAQRAATFEVGSRGSRGFAGWDVSFYHARVKDEFLSLANAAGIPLGTVNAERTLHRGVELGIALDLLGNDLAADAARRLMLRGAWNHGRFTFDDDPVYGDNLIAGLPPHLVRGELSWENDRGYYIGPTFEWVPRKSHIDHANTFAADPYALVGFKLGRRQAEGLSWFIEAKNLADKTHAATTGVIADAGGADSRNFLPGDGRGVFAGIEWRW